MDDNTCHVSAMVALHRNAFPPGWPAEDFLEHFSNPLDCVRLLTLPIGLAGFAIARISADQAEILTIVVDNWQRRRGYGQMLLSMVEDGARDMGATIMFLEVAETNTSAIRLYEGCGYLMNGKRKDYYKMNVGGIIGRVDAIVYQKHLT